MGFFDILSSVGKSLISAAEEKSQEIMSETWLKMNTFDTQRLNSLIKAKGPTSILAKIALMKLYSRSRYDFTEYMMNDETKSALIRFCKSNTVQLYDKRYSNEILRIANEIIDQYS
ncbi:hypothetical protein [Neisseria montereyensis]|uniref:Uncharacterized protein n=1 Tax=Neisseria montereyensis TaxID=2973938 RepID=A0ABT2FC05_9NEIS|nr:hypothetical protein [Neisseria montereyensis]MCS4533657.1 hypothetical protein [Neisseria montereyensis]